MIKSVNTVGVDYEELGARFEDTLGTSLRVTNDHLVIATPFPSDYVYRFVKKAFESGHCVTLIPHRSFAPVVDLWLKDPIS